MTSTTQRLFAPERFGSSATFDHVAFIQQRREGLSLAQFIAGMQAMVDSGVVWTLGPDWASEARAMIDAGLLYEEAPSQ